MSERLPTDPRAVHVRLEQKASPDAYLELDYAGKVLPIGSWLPNADHYQLTLSFDDDGRYAKTVNRPLGRDEVVELLEGHDDFVGYRVACFDSNSQAPFLTVFWTTNLALTGSPMVLFQAVDTSFEPVGQAASAAIGVDVEDLREVYRLAVGAD